MTLDSLKARLFEYSKKKDLKDPFYFKNEKVSIFDYKENALTITITPKGKKPIVVGIERIELRELDYYVSRYLKSQDSPIQLNLSSIIG